MEFFCNIGIIGCFGSIQVLDIICWLKKFLIDCYLYVIFEDIIVEVLFGYGLQICLWKIMGEICDLVVVVGGDGSMFGVVCVLVWYKVLVLGINCGSLGFFIDICLDELEVKVGEVLDGQYIVESCFFFDVQVCCGIDLMGQGDVFNDVVLYLGKLIWMIEFELYIDGQFVCSQKVDGLIVVMFIGFIVYVLFVGGLIMYLKLDVIVIVLMYLYMFFSCLIVVDGNSELKIVVLLNMQIYLQVFCDGQNYFICVFGDIVMISKKLQKLCLIYFIDYNYYEICWIKFGWGSCLGGGD